MNKNLPKLIKYIIPSDKQWAGVWFESYRGLYLPFARVDVNITGLVKSNRYNYARYMPPTRMTYKSTASDDYILGVREEA